MSTQVERDCYISPFEHQISLLNFEKLAQEIEQTSTQDVVAALGKAKNGNIGIDGFKALLSPAALPFLEEMAVLSRKKTLERFGKTIAMYVPLYLSNECKNICTYCGFSQDNPIKRKTLNDAQLLAEIGILKKMGYDHVLLVTGEDNKQVGVDYLEHAIRICKQHFSFVSMEVQPLEQDEYERLMLSGLHSVLVYQETYHKENYKIHHPKGKKSNFTYRLHTPDRLGKAGVFKIGLGVLLGLENWRVDSLLCAMHLKYLEKTYWKTRYALSFPRLRPYLNKEGVLVTPKMAMTDKELVQLICAYRLLDQELELSISTRESQTFRNNIIKLGITSMSAGSKTNPGGYSEGAKSSLEQFEIDDERNTTEIKNMLYANGYEAVWKDWDSTYDLGFHQERLAKNL